MAEILAENLSGKSVMGTDGTELGMLYNITMDLGSGALADLIIEPDEHVGETEFQRNESGRLLVPISRVEAVKDHMIIDR